MRTHLTRLAMLAAFVAAPICLPAQGQDDTRRAYDENRHAVEQMALKCDPTALRPAFAPDVKFVDNGGRVANNLAELQELVRHDCAQVSIMSWTYDTQQFGHSGDIAYGSGITRATFVDKQSGKEGQQALHFLALLRRQRDGKWTVVEEMWAPVMEQKK